MVQEVIIQMHQYILEEMEVQVVEVVLLKVQALEL